MYDFQLLTISAILSAVLLSATYFPFIRSLSTCSFFLPRVAFPSFFPRLYHAVMIHVVAHALSTRLHFLTVPNTVLVSFTLRRTSSLLIFSTQLIFSILLQIHISMAFNLFLSAWVIDQWPCFWCVPDHTPQHTLYYSLFQLTNSFFLFINACLPNAILREVKWVGFNVPLNTL